MASQARYQLLDALRGVAALAVVCQHLGAVWQLGDIAPQSFLAVDFFFVLSGFVIAHAYRNRLKTKLSPFGFLITRFVRLYPLLVAGAMLGTVVMLARANGWPPTDAIVEGGLMAVLGLPALFMASTGLGFPINPPAWSLFFELTANVVYAFVARFLTPLRIAILTAVAAAIFLKLSFDLGAIPGGWQPYGIKEGLSRVFCSFTIGLLLYEIKPEWKAPPTVGYVAALVLAVCLFLPQNLGLIGHLILIFAIWPAITWLGSAVTESRLIAHAGATIGALSYPLYILHRPLLDPLRDMFLLIDPTAAFLPVWMVLQIIIVIGVSWLAMVAFDQPVRKWLTRLLKTVRARPAHSEASNR